MDLLNDSLLKIVEKKYSEIKLELENIGKKILETPNFIIFINEIDAEIEKWVLKNDNFLVSGFVVAYFSGDKTKQKICIDNQKIHEIQNDINNFLVNSKFVDEKETVNGIQELMVKYKEYSNDFEFIIKKINEKYDKIQQYFDINENKTFKFIFSYIDFLNNLFNLYESSEEYIDKKFKESEFTKLEDFKKSNEIARDQYEKNLLNVFKVVVNILKMRVYLNVNIYKNSCKSTLGKFNIHLIYVIDTYFYEYIIKLPKYSDVFRIMHAKKNFSEKLKFIESLKFNNNIIKNIITELSDYMKTNNFHVNFLDITETREPLKIVNDMLLKGHPIIRDFYCQADEIQSYKDWENVILFKSDISNIVNDLKMHLEQINKISLSINFTFFPFFNEITIDKTSKNYIYIALYYSFIPDSQNFQRLVDTDLIYNFLVENKIHLNKNIVNEIHPDFFIIENNLVKNWNESFIEKAIIKLEQYYKIKKTETLHSTDPELRKKYEYVSQLNLNEKEKTYLLKFISKDEDFFENIKNLKLTNNLLISILELSTSYLLIHKKIQQNFILKQKITNYNQSIFKILPDVDDINKDLVEKLFDQEYDIMKDYFYIQDGNVFKNNDPDVIYDLSALKKIIFNILTIFLNTINKNEKESFLTDYARTVNNVISIDNNELKNMNLEIIKKQFEDNLHNDEKLVTVFITLILYSKKLIEIKTNLNNKTNLIVYTNINNIIGECSFLIESLLIKCPEYKYLANIINLMRKYIIKNISSDDHVHLLNINEITKKEHFENNPLDNIMIYQKFYSLEITKYVFPFYFTYFHSGYQSQNITNIILNILNKIMFFNLIGIKYKDILIHNLKNTLDKYFLIYDFSENYPELVKIQTIMQATQELSNYGIQSFYDLMHVKYSFDYFLRYYE